MNDQNHKNKLSPAAQEPFKHVMKSMDDFFNAKPLRGVMNSIDDFFQRSFVPAFPVDLYETKDELVITAEIPGVKREQIYLDIVGNTLRISVEHQDELEEKNTVHNYYRRERAYHRSERNVQLPYTVSEKQVKATYQNGILKIRAPKGQRRKSRIQIEE
ncbi:HSP20 family protein [Bacillus mesophilus]|uniref:Hsp20/alpha crystallin family protein n=1 Tax=Bacillus mesophilus TaxID=1808955 RepID=A0A6M0QBT0_9BACI|nr:Hsp20/alpha crystallin family protein [Bacillus mesophilus]MBM7662393.1 HSP20 family protein [Bacillus mesophilus]NEY72980.1 Hsp20/alpha crystallin family protein [Bacillus mesophilus]